MLEDPTGAQWAAVVGEVNIHHDSGFGAHKISPGSHVVYNWLDFALVPFPYLDRGWVKLSDDAADCVSVHYFDLDLFWVSSIFLENYQEILFGLYPRSRNMVSEMEGSSGWLTGKFH